MVELFLNYNTDEWIVHSVNCSCKRSKRDRQLDSQGVFNTLLDAQDVWEKNNLGGAKEMSCTRKVD